MRSEHQFAIKEEFEKFTSHIATTKSQHKNEANNLIAENQNLKRDFARQNTILGETEQEVTRLGAALLESHAKFNENIQLKRENTGETPFFLLKGRDALEPIDLRPPMRNAPCTRLSRTKQNHHKNKVPTTFN